MDTRLSLTSQRPIQVLMVCLGNICRSPTAHGVLEKQIQALGLEDQITVDSAGTAAYHVGKSPDSRSIAAAADRGYDISRQVSRQVEAADFQKFDYILAMDTENLASLQSLCSPDTEHKIQLLLNYQDTEINSGTGKDQSVPDPYYSAEDGFQLVLDLVEDACEHFLQALVQQHLSESLKGDRY